VATGRFPTGTVGNLTPPNILYLHSHDTGRWVQPYGHQVVTPNVQRLADQGVLFRQAFSAAPVCSGSRAALLTGLAPHSNGMLGLAHRGWSLHDPGQHLVNTLRTGGYRSVLVGEQHVSEDPGVLGYDEVLDVPSNHAAEVGPRAVEAIGRLAAAEQPWFLSVGFFETHRDFDTPTSVRDTLYSQPPANLPDAPETREDIAAFKASARTLDQGIGAVLDALQRNGLDETTLVVCTTDHGLPFPGAKATLTDRGTGVLLIMRGPGGFTGGRVVDPMVTQLDLFPTFCDVAGIPAPDRLQGRSLLPLVQGQVERLHDDVFSELTYHAAYEPTRAIRTERWKYIRRFHDHPTPVLANVDDSLSKQLLVAHGWDEVAVPREELFDLVLDPAELVDRATDPALADVVAALRTRLEAWMRATHDSLLDGPVDPPPGAVVNDPWQRSPDDPVREVRAT
jgi:arylsulfatase A-like enzyme